MKAISLENLFGIIPSWSYNGKKYLPVTTVTEWYIYRDAWGEEIDINED